jgi:hypothetical protein
MFRPSQMGVDQIGINVGHSQHGAFLKVQFRFELPDEDSNLGKQNQNLSYYHYTIGHSFNRSAKVRFVKRCSKSIWRPQTNNCAKVIFLYI